MYGYIRPLQGELKVRDLERFKACYCGLCHALGGKYGLAARFVLSYELVFLSMLLWDAGKPLEMNRKRCIAGPCRSRRCCKSNPTLDICAGYSVILSWWKLRDTAQDESFFKSIPHRGLAFALRRAYRKAAREFPGFDTAVREGIASLAEYEAQENRSLDEAADKFAQMLKAAVPESMEDEILRPLLELMYHLGRWIYIIDAYDDYRADARESRFNPLMMRFKLNDGSLAEEDASRIKTTISHSNNLVCSAYELLPENVWTEIIRNIVYLGMPEVCSHVIGGTWQTYRRKKQNGLNK